MLATRSLSMLRAVPVLMLNSPTPTPLFGLSGGVTLYQRVKSGKSGAAWLNLLSVSCGSVKRGSTDPKVFE